VHATVLKGVMQMEDSSSITSAAFELFVCEALKSTADLSLRADDMKTK
jgi:hypothetical protein